LLDAYLLVSHGSRDPRPQIAVNQLARELCTYCRQFGAVNLPILVATAQLELADKPLHVQILDFARECQDIGIERMVILPLFLIAGVHVMVDIPAEVAIAESEINDRVKLIVAPLLGSHSDFANLFAPNRGGLPSQTIILAHGSRRADGNAIVEQLARNLDLTAAYWSVSPSLTDIVTELVASGATEIGILPYFLFTGGITDAIDTLVSQLREQFPQVRLVMGKPIGNSPALVATIAKILGSIDIGQSNVK
jgi:sirohydrochlorin cobaltochelatase